MSEDDTFRRLVRHTFEDVERRWHHVLMYEGRSVQYAIEEIKKLGWSKEEFYAEGGVRHANGR